MKRTYPILFVSILMLFASCERQPVTPDDTQKKKISKIIEDISYHDEIDDIEDICEEIWEWNGNHIETITRHYYFYDSGILYEEYVEIAQFLYQDNKISTITDGHSRYEFSYHGDQLSSVACFDMEDNLSREYVYEYNGKEPTKVSLSVPSASILEEFCFEWLDGNVAKIKYYNDGSYVSSYTFRYDNKENPFYNLCVNYHGNLDNPDAFIERFMLPPSRNNVISGHHSGDIGDLNFTYTYDGELPIGRKCYDDGFVITTRYEYFE